MSGASGRGRTRSPSRPALWTALPPLVRAFLRYVARTRDPGVLPIVLLEGEVEDEIEAFTGRIFADVEAALEERLDAGVVELAPGATAVRFSYDTRLLLPAMLTHGRIHVMANDVPGIRRFRRVDGALIKRGAETTFEIVRALLDGDMRDAINDDEFEDFETTVEPRPAAARIAQECLESAVETWLSAPDTPDAVREHYTRAVRFSEGHQENDQSFRELLRAYLTARSTDKERLAEQIRDEYVHAEPSAPAAHFQDVRNLPYFGSQYERVGIIYEDMLNMYEAALSIDLGRSFKRALVLMVIAAQVGLDDTDDYPEDRETQLTPVTAELNLRGPTDGVANLRSIVGTYLDRAGDAADDHLTGMAVEFIRQEAADRLDALERSVAE